MDTRQAFREAERLSYTAWSVRDRAFALLHVHGGTKWNGDEKTALLRDLLELLDSCHDNIQKIREALQ